jgi:DNA modification methylase
MLEINNIYHGDSLELLKQLDDNSIDSIVCDPPYELGFMGKLWDSTGIAYNVDLWIECLRVLKHGGHLLSFGGTRTYHRMACAIEDAGFEIRDQIQWIYGSGFPKSHNISKALSKKGISSDEWDGWGTALKPANEPIVFARKPLSGKTVVDNVLIHGTGGINIDECRVEYDQNDTNPATNPLYRAKNGYNNSQYAEKNVNAYRLRNEEVSERNVSELGRFPANVILDEEAGRLLDEQSGITKSGFMKAGHPYGLGNGQNVYGKLSGHTKNDTYGDSGGASRFFYCAKASKKERGGFNDHPTVKPIKLMEYLVRLVTPNNGIVLDPFAGSGTTLLAARNENKNYIGFELTEEYIEIINERLKLA